MAGHGGNVHLHAAPIPPVRQRRRHAARLKPHTVAACEAFTFEQCYAQQSGASILILIRFAAHRNTLDRQRRLMKPAASNKTGACGRTQQLRILRSGVRDVGSL